MRFALLNMLGVEFFVRFAKVADAFNEGDDSRDAGPAEQKEDDALSDFPHVKLVEAKATQKNG